MNKDNAHLYLPLAQALAEGKTIQFRHSEGWKDTSEVYMSSPEHYRIKPEPLVCWALEVDGGQIIECSKDIAFIQNAARGWVTARIVRMIEAPEGGEG